MLFFDGSCTISCRKVHAYLSNQSNNVESAIKIITSNLSLVISDVRNITLRFPRTKVPAKETTYVCFNFELPDDQEYHLIATKPFIDNENVMHHMVLTTCDSTGQ